MTELSTLTKPDEIVARRGTAIVTWPIALIFLVLFSAALYASFALNSNFLLIGLDGTDWRITIATEAADRIPFAQTGVDPFQGAFDAYVPVIREYLLPDALMSLVSHGAAGNVTTYTIYGIMLLVAAYLCARRMGVEQSAALLGAFFLPAVCLPVFRGHSSLFYPLFSLNPHIAQIIVFSLLIVAAFWGIDTAKPVRSSFLMLVPAVSMVVAVLGNPGAVALLVPATAGYGGASILLPQSLRERAMRVAAGVLAAVVPVAIGMVTYYRGLVGYTAYNFFSNEFKQTRADLISASTVFWIEPYGKYAVVFGLFGAFVAVLFGRGRWRLAAATHVVLTLLFMGTAWAIITFATGYKGPSPVYFETAFWPYTLFFDATLVIGVVRLLAGFFAEAASPYMTAKYDWYGVVAILALAPALLVVSGAAKALFAPIKSAGEGLFFPIKRTPITDYLSQKIGLQPGATFNGLSATVDGVGGNASIDWLTLHGHDAQLWKDTGNDFRVVGLKYFDIPSLFQYSTYITPPFYLLITDFLSRPADRQIRSIVVLSRIDMPMMQLWGVRYIILDEDTNVGQTVITESINDQSKLWLKELPDPNLGDYSPTHVLRVSDYRSGLAILHGESFSGRSDVITDTTQPSLEGPFVPATQAQLTFEKWGGSIKAESSDRSILVLPIQFSHCWSAEGKGDVELFRANLMQLGVRFRGPLDARLVFRYGPLGAGQCRVDDLNDMNALHIRDARQSENSGIGRPEISSEGQAVAK